MSDFNVISPPKGWLVHLYPVGREHDDFIPQIGLVTQRLQEGKIKAIVAPENGGTWNAAGGRSIAPLHHRSDPELQHNRPQLMRLHRLCWDWVPGNEYTPTEDDHRILDPKEEAPINRMRSMADEKKERYDAGIEVAYQMARDGHGLEKIMEKVRFFGVTKQDVQKILEGMTDETKQVPSGAKGKRQ